MGTHASVELDDYAHEAYREYIAASTYLDEYQQRKDKAREALVNFLRLNEATLATDAGTPVLRLVEFDRLTLDTKRLKAEDPYLYRKYERVSRTVQLRTMGGTS